MSPSQNITPGNKTSTTEQSLTMNLEPRQEGGDLVVLEPSAASRMTNQQQQLRRKEQSLSRCSRFFACGQTAAASSSLLCLILLVVSASMLPTTCTAWQLSTTTIRPPPAVARWSSASTSLQIAVSDASSSSSDVSDSGSVDSSSDIQQQQQTSPSSAVTENFHRDMQRVLESRQHMLQDVLKSAGNRRHKPVVLDSDVDGACRAWSMLQHLQDIGAANEKSYAMVMRAFLQRGRLRWHDQTVDAAAAGTSIVCAADQLESLLQDLQAALGGSDEVISIDTYNLVLGAYAACSTPRGDRGYANKAHELLKQMQGLFGKDQVPVESLMHVLHAYAWQQANLQDGDCAPAASDLLEQIAERTSDPAILLPCYDWVLEAWSKSGSDKSAEEADAVFAQIKAVNATLTADSDESTLALFDAETYSNAILAWSKCGSQTGSSLTQAVRANELLLEMLDRYQSGAFPAGSEPTLIAFNGVITAWGKSGKVGKAEEVLWLMEKYRPSCQDLVPDAVSFNSVLHAHMKSNAKFSLDKVLALVQYMEDNFHLQPAIRPNTFTYSTLLKCWIQSSRPDMAESAEKVLSQMERLWREGDTAVEPNNRIFNMVINAYAKSDHRFASRKAFELLNRMKASSRQCQPDIISYTSVLECLSKSADPTAVQQAEDLLDEAFRIYERTGKAHLMPNLRTFTMAILTLAKNNGSAMKARELLTQLLEMYESTQDPLLLPNEYPYNYVLNCAANTMENKQEAFQIATQTYQEMRQSEIVKPDSFTYAFWLKCCNNLLPESDLRTKCVSYAFEECKKDGLVSKEVLTRLFQGNRPVVVNVLLEDQTNQQPYRSVKLDDLPAAWSRKTVRRGFSSKR